MACCDTGTYTGVSHDAVPAARKAMLHRSRAEQLHGSRPDQRSGRREQRLVAGHGASAEAGSRQEHSTVAPNLAVYIQ